MRFVRNFTPPDFQANTFAPSISPNFNSFSDTNTKDDGKWRNLHRWQKFYTATGSDGMEKSHLCWSNGHWYNFYIQLKGEEVKAEKKRRKFFPPKGMACWCKNLFPKCHPIHGIESLSCPSSGCIKSWRPLQPFCGSLFPVQSISNTKHFSF